jgi:hypothetical protein
VNATPDVDPADEALLARLNRVADEVDPVPPLSYDLARASFILRDIDSELAALTHDSVLETNHMVRATGASDARLLSYQAGELTVELQVRVKGAARTLLGEVHGGAVERIAVQSSGAVVEIVPDEVGRFRVEELPAGPFRIRLKTTDGRAVTTSWVRA